MRSAVRDRVLDKLFSLPQARLVEVALALPVVAVFAAAGFKVWIERSGSFLDEMGWLGFWFGLLLFAGLLFVVCSCFSIAGRSAARAGLWGGPLMPVLFFGFACGAVWLIGHGLSSYPDALLRVVTLGVIRSGAEHGFHVPAWLASLGVSPGLLPSTGGFVAVSLTVSAYRRESIAIRSGERTSAGSDAGE